MIPVTSFAGKTVAVFGLGGSGLASCHALKAGGAEVIAADDNADNVAKAAQGGFITADLRNVSWANFAALVLAPGVPLTHPVPPSFRGVRSTNTESRDSGSPLRVVRNDARARSPKSAHRVRDASGAMR